MKMEKLLVITVMVVISLTSCVTAQDTMYSMIRSLPQLSTFMRYIDQANLREELDRSYSQLEKVTVFAPVNAAFNLLTNNEKQFFERNLEKTLKYHMVLDTVSYDFREMDRAAQTQENKVPTLSPGHLLYINSIAAAPNSRLFVNGAAVQRNDGAEWVARNGRLQLIESVLNVPSSQNIWSYIDRPERNDLRLQEFDELLSALPDTTLYSSLSFGARRTFLAVTDDGLNSIPQIKLNQLKNDQQRLKQVLQAQLVSDTDEWYSGPLAALPDIQVSNDPGVRVVTVNQQKYMVTSSFSARIIAADIPCGNGVLHVIDSLISFEYNSATEQISTDSSLARLRDFVQYASTGTRDLLQRSDITVFAPANSAFDQIQAEDYSQLTQNSAAVDQILLLHIFPDRAYHFKDFNRLQRDTNDDPHPFKVVDDRNNTQLERAGVRASMIRFDISLTNGVLHKIDRVFGVAVRDAMDELSNNPYTYELSSSLSAFETTYEYLESTEQNKTFFAPSDQALRDVQEDPQLSDIFNVEWQSKLEDVLLTHTLPGTVFLFSSLRPGDVTQLQTGWGRISVSAQNDLTRPAHVTYTVRHGDIVATVIEADILTTNGAVHVIDTMLFEQSDFNRVNTGSVALSVTWLLVATVIANLIY